VRLPGGRPPLVGRARVIDAQTHLLIEHPAIAELHSGRLTQINRIYVPQWRPFSVVGIDGDTTLPVGRENLRRLQRMLRRLRASWATRIPTTTMETSITEVGYCHCSIDWALERAR